MSHESPDQFDWLAWRYVAGELSAAEHARFESMLTDNQSAREAVAAAVQTWQAVLEVAPQSAPAIMPVSVWERMRRPLGWVATAAAACVVMALLIEAIIPGDARRSPVVVAPADLDELSALALAWAETLETPAASFDEAPSVDAMLLEDSALDDGYVIEFVGEESEADDAMFGTPSWMLAALADSTDSAERLEN